jgi:hypothetical protein
MMKLSLAAPRCCWVPPRAGRARFLRTREERYSAKDHQQRRAGIRLYASVPNDQPDQPGAQVVGHCANDTFKITYTRSADSDSDAR